MNVGVITYDYLPPIGGLGLHVARLEQGIKTYASDIKMTVLSPSSRDASSFARSRWNKKGGSIALSLSLLWSMKRFVKKNTIDLLHIHAGSGGVFILVKPKIPLIATVHHTMKEEASVYAHQRCIYWRKMFIAKLEKRTLKLCDRVMCVSADTKKVLIDQYGIASEKIGIVENSIDDRFFIENTERRDEKTILFVGRIEPRKGIDVLLKAMAIVRRQVPDVRLKIAGQNLLGDQLRKMMKDSKDSEESGDSIELLGFVSDDQYLELLHTSTIVVVPSRQEGFGLVAAEGMAAGIPVVASNCNGLRSIIDHEKTGLLFPTENDQECAKQILRLLHDASLRSTLQSNAYLEAKKRFTVERQVRETIAIYTKG